MLSRLRDLLANTDMMTIVAIAAVGWSISQLSKAAGERKTQIGEMTAIVGDLGAEIGKRQAVLEEIRSQERAYYAERDTKNQASDEPAQVSENSD